MRLVCSEYYGIGYDSGGVALNLAKAMDVIAKSNSCIASELYRYDLQSIMAPWAHLLWFIASIFRHYNDSAESCVLIRGSVWTKSKLY